MSTMASPPSAPSPTTGLSLAAPPPPPPPSAASSALIPGLGLPGAAAAAAAAHPALVSQYYQMVAEKFWGVSSDSSAAHSQLADKTTVNNSIGEWPNTKYVRSYSNSMSRQGAKLTDRMTG